MPINANKKVIKTILISFLMFIVLELVLQMRAYIRFGQNSFYGMFDQAPYVYNRKLQLKLPRPNMQLEFPGVIIETNSLGLRSPEVKHTKNSNEIRVAVVGASSIMGTYTENNAATIPYRLEALLKKRFPLKKISVINAGISGYTVELQTRLLNRVIKPLSPDLIVWYPGFNDITRYCRLDTTEETNRPILPTLALPKWLLTVELLVKNTAWLRSAKFVEENNVRTANIDARLFSKSVNEFFSSVKNNHLPVITVTGARSFKRDMPLKQQEELSETARSYNDCFDVNNLHAVYDLHNKLVAEQSLQFGFPVLRLDQFMPGGEKYFGDAVHFTAHGNEFVANEFAHAIISSGDLLNHDDKFVTREAN